MSTRVHLTMLQGIPMIVPRPKGQYSRGDIGHFSTVYYHLGAGFCPSPSSPRPVFCRGSAKCLLPKGHDTGRSRTASLVHLLRPMEFKSSSQSEPIHRKLSSPNLYQAPVLGCDHPPLPCYENNVLERFLATWEVGTTTAVCACAKMSHPGARL